LGLAAAHLRDCFSTGVDVAAGKHQNENRAVPCDTTRSAILVPETARIGIDAGAASRARPIY
jgi:hypothetical protein